MRPQYRYRARITSVYDGDTVRADIDLGFSTWIKNTALRLLHINTPELRGEEKEEGIVARDRVRELVLDKEVVIETVEDKAGKYGRYLAIIWFETAEGEWLSLNHLLVEEGLAQPYMT